MNQKVEALEAHIQAFLSRAITRRVKAERHRLSDPSGYKLAAKANKEELKALMDQVKQVLEKKDGN
jgi:uncharacterized protein YPO0396